MSSKPLIHNDYGRFEDLWILLYDVLSLDVPLPIKDIRRYCQEISIGISISIDATIDLMEYLGWIRINKDSVLVVKEIMKFKDDDIALKKSLFENLIVKLKEDRILLRFINIESVKYDVVNDGVCLRNNTIPLKFSGLRNFCFELGVFNKHELPTLIRVNPIFSEFFIQEVIFWINANLTKDVASRILSYEQFLRIQETKNKYGAEAETFVCNYERKRLNGHCKASKIKIISEIDVGAGFDIVSFNDYESEIFDRFIEVKSYSGVINFYWSKYEIEAAELKQDRYYLYLVDREKQAEEKYTPIIIQNPFEVVFESDAWIKKVETWKIKPSS